MECKSDSDKGDLHLRTCHSIKLKLVRVEVNAMLDALDASGYKRVVVDKLMLQKTLLEDLEVMVRPFGVTTRNWLLHENGLSSRVNAQARWSESDMWYVECDSTLFFLSSHGGIKEDKRVVTDEVDTKE